MVLLVKGLYVYASGDTPLSTPSRTQILSYKDCTYNFIYLFC